MYCMWYYFPRKLVLTHTLHILRTSQWGGSPENRRDPICLDEVIDRPLEGRRVLTRKEAAP